MTQVAAEHREQLRGFRADALLAVEDRRRWREEEEERCRQRSREFKEESEKRRARGEQMALALKAQQDADRAQAEQERREAEEVQAEADERERWARQAKDERDAAISAREAAGMQAWNDAGRREEAELMAEEEREKARRRGERQRERESKEQERLRVLRHVADLDAQTRLLRAADASALAEQRRDAELMLAQHRRALAHDAALKIERKEAARAHQADVLMQRRAELRNIRLGAGQYGVTLHEAKVNALGS